MTRTTTIALPLALLLVAIPACGSSGETYTGPQLSPTLNRFEKLLAGTYDLLDFTFYQVGSQPLFQEDFETWQGSLVLQEDRYAAIVLELCESAGGETESCRHEFIWSASAGWIHLYGLGNEGPNLELVWEARSGGIFETEVRVPQNRPDCSYLRIEEGREVLVWAPAD